MASNWTVSFIVSGVPVPQGSKTAMPRRGGGTIMLEGSPKHHGEWKLWRSLIQAAGASYKNKVGRDPVRREELALLQSGPLEVDLTFWLKRPKSAPKKRVFPDVKPDPDKLTRAVFDGVTDACLWGDDAQVCEFRVRKLYEDRLHDPGVLIRIRQFRSLVDVEGTGLDRPGVP